jgi:hypothetical protein
MNEYKIILKGDIQKIEENKKISFIEKQVQIQKNVSRLPWKNPDGTYIDGRQNASKNN